MEEPLGEWSTSNLALAAFLLIQDHDYVRTDWQDSLGRMSCSWVFRPTTELADDVSDFEGGNARVDPKRFNYIFGRMKRDMMEELPASR